MEENMREEVTTEDNTISIVDKVLSDKNVIEYFNVIEDKEKDRLFCKHDFNHAKEVARVLTSLSKRRKLENYEELSGLIAYLHDVGRAIDTGKGDGNKKHHHNTMSSDIARTIMTRYSYNEEYIDIVCNAIYNHSVRMDISDIRDYIDNNAVEENVNDTWTMLLRIADQLSRKCYECSVSSTCKWLPEEKNIEDWESRL